MIAGAKKFRVWSLPALVFTVGLPKAAAQANKELNLDGEIYRFGAKIQAPGFFDGSGAIAYHNYSQKRHQEWSTGACLSILRSAGSR